LFDVKGENMKKLKAKIDSVVFKLSEKFKGKMVNDEGVGIIEVILILVILIAIVLIFKREITTIINNAFQAITRDSGTIIS